MNQHLKLFLERLRCSRKLLLHKFLQGIDNIEFQIVGKVTGDIAEQESSNPDGEILWHYEFEIENDYLMAHVLWWGRGINVNRRDAPVWPRNTGIPQFPEEGDSVRIWIDEYPDVGFLEKSKKLYLTATAFQYEIIPSPTEDT